MWRKERSPKGYIFVIQKMTSIIRVGSKNESRYKGSVFFNFMKFMVASSSGLFFAKDTVVLQNGIVV